MTVEIGVGVGGGADGFFVDRAVTVVVGAVADLRGVGVDVRVAVVAVNVGRGAVLIDIERLDLGDVGVVFVLGDPEAAGEEGEGEEQEGL